MWVAVRDAARLYAIRLSTTKMVGYLGVRRQRPIVRASISAVLTCAVVSPIVVARCLARAHSGVTGVWRREVRGVHCAARVMGKVQRTAAAPSRS